LIFQDKILVVGGYEPFLRADSRTKLQTPNLLLVDPRKEEFKVLPPKQTDIDCCFYSGTSACCWKDSKIVIFGGRDPSKKFVGSTVSIITLKDLSSDSLSLSYFLSIFDILLGPSALWEKVQTQNTLHRRRHAAHIYQDKMYVFGGYSEKDQPVHDIWCLDLS